jgi:hypothetical protein
MDLQALSALLGNIGEFFGAIAILVIGIYAGDLLTASGNIYRLN